MACRRPRQSLKHRFAAVAVLLVVAAFVTAIPAHAGGPAGNLLWEDDFQVAGGQNVANAVAASHGRVVAVGSAGEAANSDLVVRAYDARVGALLWEDRVVGEMSTATAVVMDKRHVVAAAASTELTGKTQTLIRAYLAKNGVLAWEHRVPLTAVRLAMEGSRVLVTGMTTDSSDNGEVLVRSYVAGSGVVAWERLLPIGGLPLVVLKTGSPNGGKAFLVGTDNLTGSCVVRAYDLDTTALLWEAVHESNCRPLATTTDGKRIIVAGQGGVFLDDYLVQTYDAETGRFLWEDRTFVSTGFDNAASAVDTERRLAFVVGWVRWLPGHDNQEALLVRTYDVGTGALRWEDQFPSESACLCHGSAVLADEGRVFAVARDEIGGTVFVRAYDAKRGDLLWQVQFASGRLRNDGPYFDAIAADSGRVFVGGSGLNAEGNTEFLVQVYDGN
jgi:outer membrane protein assembly factor BamB